MSLLERYEKLLHCPSPEDVRRGYALPLPEVDTKHHLPYLREQALGNVLEIGCDVGHSTTALLLGVREHGGHVWSMDINPDCANNFPNNPQWTFIHADSQDNLVPIKLAVNTYVTLFMELDLLYVDGDHTYEGALNDITHYGQWVKRGGLILVHDVEHPNFPGVAQAVRDYCAATDRTHTVRHGSWGLAVINV